jgi:hypothetical protein
MQMPVPTEARQPGLVVGWTWKAPAVLVSSAPFWRTAAAAVKLPQGVTVLRPSSEAAALKGVPANSGVLLDEAV